MRCTMQIPHDIPNSQENAGGCNRATTIRLQIDNDGTLLIDAGDGIIELAPSETRELGQFMIDTEPVWA